jgi:hypothetical protein
MERGAGRMVPNPACLEYGAMLKFQAVSDFVRAPSDENSTASVAMV